MVGAAPGLYVYRARKPPAAGGGELDVPFEDAAKAGGGGWELRRITSDGAVTPGGVGCLATVRDAVEQDGGVCIFKSGNWNKELSRAWLVDDAWAFYTRACAFPVHDAAAAALGRFLARNPGYAGMVQRKKLGPAATIGQPSQAVQLEPKADISGFHVISAVACAGSSGPAEVPLICQWVDGGWRLEGNTPSGALLPAEGRTNLDMFHATAAAAWGCDWDAASSSPAWSNNTRRVYLRREEWRFPRSGGHGLGSCVQAAAAQALTSFLQQHPWAAGLACTMQERRQQQQQQAAAAAQAQPVVPAEQPAASREGCEGGGSGSYQAAPGVLASRSGGSFAAPQAAKQGGGLAAAPAAAAVPVAGQAADGCGVSSAGLSAGAWLGSRAGSASWRSGRADGGSRPVLAAVQPGGQSVAAAPALLQPPPLPPILQPLPPPAPLQPQPPPQEAPLPGPWSGAAEAQRLREGNRALAAENAALRQSLAELEGRRARKVHLKARAKELKLQLAVRKDKVQRMHQALAEAGFADLPLA